MNPDSFDILRAADPAATMPEPTPEEHERLRQAIIASPPEPQNPYARRRSRRRIALFATVAGTVILLGGTGVYAASYFLDPISKGPNPPMSAAQWRAEYEKWTHQIPLPPGEHWRGFRDPDNASTSIGAGHMDAVFEAMGHWTREWMAAAKAGDAGRVAAAESWVARLRATIPTITDEDTAQALGSAYGTEAMAGQDQTGSDAMDTAIAKAKAGDFDQLMRTVLGHTYWPTPQATPSPRYYLGGLSSSGYRSEDDMNVDYGIFGTEAWAEYTAVLKAVGVPPGMDASGEKLASPYDAFTREAVKKYGRPTSPLPARVSPHDQLTAPGHHTFGEGFESAFNDLWSLWWREWAAAAKAGDRQRAAAAAAATARLQRLVPHTGTHYTPTHEARVITWFQEPEQKRDLEQLAAQARGGDMRGVNEWLDFQVWSAWSMLDAAGYYNR
jgi:hypothetical protein